MKNQEQINFEQKCIETFNEKHCILNQEYVIEFVYNLYCSNNNNINLVNKLDSCDWLGYCCKEYKTIYINMKSKHSLDYMYEVFLHEMGHSMQFKHNHNKEFRENVKEIGGVLIYEGGDARNLIEFNNRYQHNP